MNPFFHSLLFEIPSSDSLLARTDINTQDRQESAVGVVSAVSACHCESVLDSTGYLSTAASHQDHCCRCTPQSQGPSLRQREVGTAGARGRSNPLAGARGRTACMRRAGKPVVKARGPSARRTVWTICSLEHADTPLAETRTRSARRQADNAFNGARYGGLHKFHQISFGYGQTILLYGMKHWFITIFRGNLSTGINLNA